MHCYLTFFPYLGYMLLILWEPFWWHTRQKGKSKNADEIWMRQSCRAKNVRCTSCRAHMQQVPPYGIFRVSIFVNRLAPSSESNQLPDGGDTDAHDTAKRRYSSRAPEGALGEGWRAAVREAFRGRCLLLAFSGTSKWWPTILCCISRCLYSPAKILFLLKVFSFYSLLTLSLFQEKLF